jgi:hypothetical protein
MPTQKDDFVTKDLLLGAGPIAEDFFGTDTPENRRKVYHLHTEKVLPTFRFGGRLAATRTALRTAITELAANAAAARD